MNSETYIKGKKELELLLDEIKNCQNLFIYSAGNRAKEIIQMRKIGFLDIPKPTCFLVTGMKGNRESVDNPPEIDGIPVYTLHNCDVFHDEGKTMILVVAMEHYHQEIKEGIENSVFSNICVRFLSDVMEKILIAECIEYYYKRLDMPFVMTDMRDTDVSGEGDNDSRSNVDNSDDADSCDNIYNAGNAANVKKPTLMSYMVQSVHDVPLKEERVQRDWITTLQAGASLTKNRLSDVTDADGDNISSKNTYYNEMTGMYWLWKNTKWDISGICHYRRQFESDIALEPLFNGSADVVLPMPTLVYPDLRGYYCNWGEDAYYQMMLQVVKEQKAAYYETALWCAEHEIFYPNNIFLAKREILEDYCQFAFDIIDEVEERMKTYDGVKQKRCWLSEHVTTIYFIKHHKDYKIVFSNLKRFW